MMFTCNLSSIFGVDCRFMDEHDETKGFSKCSSVVCHSEHFKHQLICRLDRGSRSWVFESGLDLSDLQYRQVLGSCEYGNNYLSFTNGREFG